MFQVISDELKVHSTYGNGRRNVYVTVRENTELLKSHCGPLHLRHVTVQPSGKQLLKKLSFQLLLNTVVYTLADNVSKIPKQKRSGSVLWFEFLENFRNSIEKR